LFKFHAYLFDYLLALCDIGFRVITGQTLARTTDSETLVIEETSDLTDDQNVLSLVVTAVTPSLYRF